MTRPNFNIIEGHYEDIDYESFKEDYMNMFIPKSEILKKYDLTHNRYLKYGRQVYKDTGFKRSSGVPSVGMNTNIKSTGKRFRVDKEIKGKKFYCGTYDTIEDARRVRDFLVEHNWSNNAIEYCIKGKLV